jgi:hypothetical protein
VDDVTLPAATISAAGVATAAQILKLEEIEAKADITDAVNIASSIVGVDAKATPVDADSIAIIDSVNSNVLKESTFTNLKAFYKTYFDTLYTDIPVVYAKTTSATLTATEVSGLNTVHNDGAVGEVIMTWPALVNGQEAVFYVNDAQYLQIKAPAATTIRMGSVTSAAAGYIRSNVVGNWVRIKAMPDGLVVFGVGGTWTYDE